MRAVLRRRAALSVHLRFPYAGVSVPVWVQRPVFTEADRIPLVYSVFGRAKRLSSRFQIRSAQRYRPAIYEAVLAALVYADLYNVSYDIGNI